MRLSRLKVEYKIGNVELIENNILVQDVTDMEAIEYWENRLTNMKQDFTIVYREESGKVLYSVFADLRRKGSPFR